MTATVLLVLIVAAGVLGTLPWLVRRSPRTVGRAGDAGGAGAPAGGRATRAGSGEAVVVGRGVGRGVGPGASRRTTSWPARPSPGAGEPDPALLLDLVAIALEAGAPVPAVLASVGAAWPGATGEAMVRAAGALSLGAPWEVAWPGGGGPHGGGPRGGATGMRPLSAASGRGRRGGHGGGAGRRAAVGVVADAVVGAAVARRAGRSSAPAGVRVLRDALAPAWSAGASPMPLLRTAADRLRSRRRARSRAAAGRLSVQLVLPLTVCYLPAFVLVGLVPVVVSLATGLVG